MNNKIQAKDLINLGLFTVLYFVIGCCVAIPIGFVPIFLPVLGALWALITGIPFMLFLTRVKKFGMVTIMGILSGLLMGLTGMGFWGVPLGAVFGLLGDLILKSGGYKSAKKSLLGYAAFILWSGWGLMMDTLSPLLGESPSPELVEHIEHTVMSYPGVLGVHDLMVHDYGPGNSMWSEAN